MSTTLRGRNRMDGTYSLEGQTLIEIKGKLECVVWWDVNILEIKVA